MGAGDGVGVWAQWGRAYGSCAAGAVGDRYVADGDEGVGWGVLLGAGCGVWYRGRGGKDVAVVVSMAGVGGGMV